MEYSELDDLIDQVESAGESLLEGDTPWRDFWNLVTAAREAFREVRYPTRDMKNEARDRLEGIVDETKERQATQSEEIRAEYIDRLESIDIPSPHGMGAAIGGLVSGVIGSLNPGALIADSLGDDVDSVPSSSKRPEPSR